jgi:hypothetical protein
MRKADAASVAATKTAGNRDERAVEVVCLALVLALIVLASRIASIW